MEYAEQGIRSYGGGKIIHLHDWERAEIFPKSFDRSKIGKVYQDRVVELPDENLRALARGNYNVRNLFDADGKYDFLLPRDVIGVAIPEKPDKKEWIEITYKRAISVEDYLKESGDAAYAQHDLERRTGRKLKPSEKFTILEFRTTYEWKFDPSKRR